MKQKFALLVLAGALAGSMSLTAPVAAEPVSVAQLKLETQPKRPGSPIPTPATPGFKAEINKTGPGNVAPLPPIVHNCMPGYTKTKYLEHQGTTNIGALHTMECRSPIFECPDKTKVKGDNGVSANGQGITIKKVPVGPSGDYNRFRIEYTCNYYWHQG